MTAPSIAPSLRGTWQADDLDHIVCSDCDPDTALCGADVSDASWKDDLPDLCVVCDDLEPLPCARCGAL